jgi:hypothetical protein
LQDRDRAGQSGGLGEAGQVGYRLGDGGGRLVGQSQNDDAGMAARRVGADITHALVEGDQDPLSCGGSGDHILVGRAFQALTGDGVDMVTGAGQYFSRRNRQVLVEFELHRCCGSGSSSSRASAAP